MKKLLFYCSFIACFLSQELKAQVGGTCNSMAGEPTTPLTQVCEGDNINTTDADSFFNDATGGLEVQIPPLPAFPIDGASENYFVTDANGDIINIVDEAGAQNYDWTTVQTGETICFYQLAYSQLVIDLILGFLNDPLCTTLCFDAGIPGVPPVCPGDLVGDGCPEPFPAGTNFGDFAETLNALGIPIGIGANIADLQGFLSNPDINIPGIGSILDLNSIDIDVPVPNFGDVTLTIEDLCVSISSTPYCIEVLPASDAACSAQTGCDITSLIAANPVCGADGTTYDITLTWTDGPDASLSLLDINANGFTGSDISLDANGSVTFNYNAGTDANITLTDTENTCVYGPFNIIDPQCATSNCLAQAPVLAVDAGDCTADDGNGFSTPFIFSDDASDNQTAPYITEFIVTNGSSGAILGVFGNLVDAQNQANFSADTTTNTLGVCIQAINHDSNNLNEIILALDTAVPIAGILCGGLIPDCSTIVSLEEFYGVIGGVATLNSADIIDLVGAPNAGSSVDLGALLGFPIPLVVDVPPFCYNLSNEVCILPTECATTPPIETIPTLSEWGLITLALMLMSYGTIAMAGVGSLAGTNNVNTPIGFQLPMNGAILRKAFMFTVILALVGYTMSIVLFGAIFFSDIIGVAIAGPVFAYLAHLLYLAEKNK